MRKRLRRVPTSIEPLAAPPLLADAAAPPPRPWRADRPAPRALVPSPPIDASDGGYIAEGYDAALDDLRDAGGRPAAPSPRWRPSIRTADRHRRAQDPPQRRARLSYRGAARVADPLMRPTAASPTARRSPAWCASTRPSCTSIACQGGQAGAHALAAEAAHLEDLTAAALDRREPIAATADALARLDVAAGLAERAAEGGWAARARRPALFRDRGRPPPGGRAALRRSGERFVANDCSSETDRLWLVTGPNMGGKSTFLRQNALIAVLAQAGSFVPAAAPKLGLVDRLFSRVGASDNLARGRSTFMVEMVETAAILAQATPKSFVILDEVGRGTSTYDGLAIAWAVVEAIHEDNRCRCLFATHYHELTRLAERCDALSLHHVRARGVEGRPGPAPRSQRRAGRSQLRLRGRAARRAAARGDRARQVGAGKLEAGRARPAGSRPGSTICPVRDPLREALDAVDADALSPREALDILYRLKTLASQ
jgi:DNA mismatch repair protein MutS